MKNIKTIKIICLIVISLLLTAFLNDNNNGIETSKKINTEYESIYNQSIIQRYFDIEKRCVVVSENIPYNTVTKYNDEIFEGRQKIVTEGMEGKIETVYLEEYVNGDLINKINTINYNIVEPTNEVIEVGTKPYLSPADEKLEYSETITMSSTAYDLSFESIEKYPGDEGFGITYSGTVAGPGTVAVDPKVIPLGTKLYVESLDGTVDYGFAVAEDTGGAIKGKKIDLFFNNHDEALKYGIKNVKVYILED